MTDPEPTPPATAESSPAPAAAVNPAPTAADAYPDHMIQGFVGSGSPAEGTIHYRSRGFEPDEA